MEPNEIQREVEAARSALTRSERERERIFYEWWQIDAAERGPYGGYQRLADATPGASREVVRQAAQRGKARFDEARELNREARERVEGMPPFEVIESLESLGMSRSTIADALNVSVDVLAEAADEGAGLGQAELSALKSLYVTGHTWPTDGWRAAPLRAQRLRAVDSSTGGRLPLRAVTPFIHDDVDEDAALGLLRGDLWAHLVERGFESVDDDFALYGEPRWPAHLDRLADALVGWWSDRGFLEGVTLELLWPGREEPDESAPRIDKVVPVQAIVRRNGREASVRVPLVLDDPDAFAAESSEWSAVRALCVLYRAFSDVARRADAACDDYVPRLWDDGGRP